MLDFFFYYKYIMRYIFFLKKSQKKFHFFDILEIKKSMVYFNLINIVDLSNLSISNYMFFFKFFFGKIPFFSSYKHFFKLNINYYNFIISYNFEKKYVYYILYFFINDIYFLISKNSILLKKEQNFWEFTISDMNFFIEKKNSIGFFHLKDYINFRFFFNMNKWLNFFNFFNIYKI